MSHELARSPLEYRKDIDGLRAIAVLSVVIFHAFPPWLPGGFGGVDVFFVISGFLISTILFEGLERGTFAFSSFYARRVNRIFPALLLVLGMTFAAGWTLLLAPEYASLGKHIAAGAGFVSNFVLWSESGYFDAAAETKPLLHLWSLAIEEQFYLLWPLCLWAMAKLGNTSSRPLYFVALLSFFSSIYQAQDGSPASFFSPHCRFWELLVGALLAQAARAGNQATPGTRGASGDRRSVCGVVLIACSAAVGPNYVPPWLVSSLQTAGAALLIAAGPKALINHRVLSNPLLVWIGLISYPLYLWHWPLLAFLRILVGQVQPLSYRVLAVCVALLLAWLTYRWVERPIRFGRPSRTKVVGLAALMIALAVVGLLCDRNQGFKARGVVLQDLGGDDNFDEGVAIPSCGTSVVERALLGECRMDSRPGVHLAVIGDSKASALYAGLMRTSREQRRWLFIGGVEHGVAVPVLSDADLYREHQSVARATIAAIVANDAIDTVAIVTAARQLFKLEFDYSIEDLPTSPNGPLAFQGLNRTVERLIEAGKRVILVVDNPTLRAPNDCIPRVTLVPWVNLLLASQERPGCVIPLAQQRRLSASYLELLNRIQAAHPAQVTLFDPTPILCDVEHDVCRTQKNGRRLYSYSDHISDYAAGLIGAELNKLVTVGSAPPTMP